MGLDCPAICMYIKQPRRKTFTYSGINFVVCGERGILAAQALRDNEPPGFSSLSLKRKKAALRLLLAEREGT